MHTINWYPGHMAKARRMLEDNLKLVDMIIEIVDARAPMACRNPDFEALFKNKLRVVVLNKSDLSSKTQNRAWISYFAKQGITAAEFISTQPSTRKRAIELIEKTGDETVRRYREKGIKKTLRAMVVGVPNVGKSTFINTIAGRRLMDTGGLSEKTGRGRHTTRHSELFMVTDGFRKPTFLIDSPGFSMLESDEIEPQHLQDCYPEMYNNKSACRFADCSHTGEPGCFTEALLSSGKMHPQRLARYVRIYEELEEKHKNRYRS